jgi:hypothetical protein
LFAIATLVFVGVVIGLSYMWYRIGKNTGRDEVMQGYLSRTEVIQMIEDNARLTARQRYLDSGDMEAFLDNLDAITTWVETKTKGRVTYDPLDV